MCSDHRTKGRAEVGLGEAVNQSHRWGFREQE